MSTVRIHTYRVDPANLEQLLAQRANLIAGIRANNPGLIEARLTRHDDGTYTDAWRWQSCKELRYLIGPGFQGCMSIPGWSGGWRRNAV